MSWVTVTVELRGKESMKGASHRRGNTCYVCTNQISGWSLISAYTRWIPSRSAKDEGTDLIFKITLKSVCSSTIAKLITCSIKQNNTQSYLEEHFRIYSLHNLTFTKSLHWQSFDWLIIDVKITSRLIKHLNVKS